MEGKVATISANKEQYSTPDSYAFYLNTSDNPVIKSIYLDIVNKFFKYFMCLVFNGEEVKLPLKMGSIFIEGVKIKPKIVDGELKGLAPDWVSTKSLWDSNPEAKEKKTLVYHFNEHTGGVRYKIKWVKKDIFVEDIKFYSLVFSRDNKRDTHKMITSGKEYIVREKH